MHSILFSEAYCHPENLFPFTLTRRMQDIRMGIFTLREKWELFLQMPSYDKWEGDYKESERSLKIDNGLAKGGYYLIHANILPDPALVEAVKKLLPGELLVHAQAGALALSFTEREVTGLHQIKVHHTVSYEAPIRQLVYPWDIFRLNDDAIRLDLALVQGLRRPAALSATNRVIGNGTVFLEEGARVEHCLLNTETGPVYIGKDAEVMEGSSIRGPFALGEKAVVKMGSRIYGATTIGPQSTAGGEIKNSVIMGYSNKAHDGYLGDAVIGEWCNLGAGTSASNVKNNAGDVWVYHPASAGGRANAGMKCGLLMGDYSRAAIHTSFNTGTVVGVSCNVFGSGLLPKYIPGFSWGTDGLRKYEFDKALRDIRNWKQLKNAELLPREENILKYIYDNF
ncbi:MAG: putative sugar nucleotidyl transferase [Flavihumibacter sp.]